jgi:acetylornithine deacetylase
MNLFELTRKLMDTSSVTGDEAGVSKLLFEYLIDLGYEVELQPVGANRWNVIAAGSEPARIVFSTHMDTVPPFIQSTEDSDKIHGRGSCDAKGILAAQIFAAERLRAEGIDEIGLLFTVDEEAGSAGARAANSHPRARECRYLINGEPTDNKLAIGTKGSLRLRLQTTGRPCHSAYPEQGESAIEKLLDVLSEIRAIEWPGDSFFGETTCNFGIISGGTRANVIPAEASATLQVRLATDAGRIKNQLERIVSDRAAIDYLSVSEPLHLTEVEGFDQCVVRFTTDIPYLTNWGSPLLIGPGSILVAHTADEFVAKRELNEAVDIYAELARTLLSRVHDEEMSKGVGA